MYGNQWIKQVETLEARNRELEEQLAQARAEIERLWREIALRDRIME